MFPNCLDARVAVHPELRAIWFALQDPGLDMLIDLHSDSGLAVPHVLMDRHIVQTFKCCIGCRKWQKYLDCIQCKSIYLHDYRRYQLQRSLSGAVLNSLQVPV